MTTDRQRHPIGGLFVFLLLGMFAVLSILLVAIGSRAYRSSVERAEVNVRARGAVNYLLNKAHACDAYGAARVTDGALVLPAGFDEEGYALRIYAHDGWLMEQIVSPDDETFEPLYGEKLFEVESLQISQSDGRIQVSITIVPGETYVFHIAIRSA